jgi:hypothetical protein
MSFEWALIISLVLILAWSIWLDNDKDHYA